MKLRSDRHLSAGRRTLRSGAVANVNPTAEIHRPIKEVDAAIRQQRMDLRKRQRRLTCHNNRAAENSKPKSDKLNIKAQRAEFNVKPNQPKPASRPPNPVDSSSCGEEGYVTSGTTMKRKPGKRIRWRNAIKEDDYVRQNLTREFLRVK